MGFSRTVMHCTCTAISTSPQSLLSPGNLLAESWQLRTSPSSNLLSGNCCIIRNRGGILCCGVVEVEHDKENKMDYSSLSRIWVHVTVLLSRRTVCRRLNFVAVFVFVFVSADHASRYMNLPRVARQSATSCQ